VRKGGGFNHEQRGKEKGKRKKEEKWAPETRAGYAGVSFDLNKDE